MRAFYVVSASAISCLRASIRSPCSGPVRSATLRHARRGWPGLTPVGQAHICLKPELVSDPLQYGRTPRSAHRCGCRSKASNAGASGAEMVVQTSGFRAHTELRPLERRVKSPARSVRESARARSTAIDRVSSSPSTRRPRLLTRRMRGFSHHSAMTVCFSI